MIRVSLATASKLELKKYKIDAEPTTLYFELNEKCTGRCTYCTQKKGYLSRVKWPLFDIEKIQNAIKNINVNRICIQCPNSDNTMNLLVDVIKKLNMKVPISASIGALSEKKLITLKRNGIERVGIGLDCISEIIFNEIKLQTDSWKSYQKTIDNAKRIFGTATCHLIIGLGETDKDFVDMIKELTNKGITIALFALYIDNKTAVSLPRYRTLQLAKYNIEHRTGKIIIKNNKIVKIKNGEYNGEAFITSGCPYCNRPFYNERVTKIYNYPYNPNPIQIQQAIMEANKYARIYTVN